MCLLALGGCCQLNTWRVLECVYPSPKWGHQLFVQALGDCFKGETNVLECPCYGSKYSITRETPIKTLLCCLCVLCVRGRDRGRGGSDGSIERGREGGRKGGGRKWGIYRELVGGREGGREGGKGGRGGREGRKGREGRRKGEARMGWPWGFGRGKNVVIVIGVDYEVQTLILI